MNAPSENREHLIHLLKDFHTAMLVTRSIDGRIHARPMAIAELEQNGDIYLITSTDSPKMAEIEKNSWSALTFQGAQEFASIYGNIEMVSDRIIIDRVWKESWKAYFPGGKDDPTIALLRFDAIEGEYWDDAGAKGLKYVFNAVKAYATGDKPSKVPLSERPQPGATEHSKVPL
jgi:general stress protein 26